MIVARKVNVETTIIDDEAVLIDTDKGIYYGLEGASKDLWDTLSSGSMSTDKIIDDWSISFDNSKSEITEMLQIAIAMLQEHGLIVVEA